jgi:hypothetical protein
LPFACTPATRRCGLRPTAALLRVAPGPGPHGGPGTSLVGRAPPVVPNRKGAESPAKGDGLFLPPV